MKIYLAARYSRREELCKYKSKLTQMGHTITSRWLNGTHELDSHGLSAEAPKKARERFAIEDREDVMAADMLIAFTEEPRSSNSRGGRHVELGMAIADPNIQTIVIGPRENVFCHLPEVRVYKTFEEFLKYEMPAVPPSQ